MAKKKYTAKERKAYHMGRAYKTAKLGKRVKCPDKKTEQSFKNGVNSVKSKKPARKGFKHYGTPIYAVDNNGVVLGVLNGGAK